MSNPGRGCSVGCAFDRVLALNDFFFNAPVEKGSKIGPVQIMTIRVFIVFEDPYDSSLEDMWVIVYLWFGAFVKNPEGMLVPMDGLWRTVNSFFVIDKGLYCFTPSIFRRIWWFRNKLNPSCHTKAPPFFVRRCCHLEKRVVVL